MGTTCLLWWAFQPNYPFHKKGLMSVTGSTWLVLSVLQKLFLPALIPLNFRFPSYLISSRQASPASCVWYLQMFHCVSWMGHFSIISNAYGCQCLLTFICVRASLQTCVWVRLRVERICKPGLSCCVCWIRWRMLWCGLSQRQAWVFSSVPRAWLTYSCYCPI